MPEKKSNPVKIAGKRMSEKLERKSQLRKNRFQLEDDGGDEDNENDFQ